MKSCKACGFWVREKGSGGMGECRRYAPRSEMFGGVKEKSIDSREVIVPRTSAKHWCGDFTVRE